MFWDVIERIQDYINMSLRPALRSLFSSKSFFVSMLLAVFVLQTLLCVICFAGVNNTQNQSELLEAYSSYIAGLNENARQELAEQVKVLMNSAGIFTGALVIWWLCAVTVYYRIATASAERNRYIWGMYMTFGAARRKLRKMLGVEMFLTLAGGTVLGLPAAYFICRVFTGNAPENIPAVALLAIAVSFITVKVCIIIEARAISSKTCASMLASEDSAGNVISPRGSGMLARGFTPSRYALTAFSRLRRYYAWVALAAAVPCVIWICCMTASISESVAINNDIDEFTLSMSGGFDPDMLEQDYLSDLEQLDGVKAVSAPGDSLASALGTHLLTLSEHITPAASTVLLGTTYAVGDIYIVDASDPSFHLSTGYTATPSVGEVSIIYPNDYNTLNFDEFIDSIKYEIDESTNQMTGQIETDELYIKFAVSENNGQITVSPDTDKALEVLTQNDYDFIRLRLRIASKSVGEDIGVSDYLKIDRPYFILNHEDYARVTSLTSGADNVHIDNSDFTLSTSAYTDGSFDIIINRRLDKLPVEGTCITLDDRELANIGLSVTGGEATVIAEADGEYDSFDEDHNPIRETHKKVNNTIKFSELYVIGARYSGDTTVITVSPHVAICLHRYASVPVLIANYLLLGMPDIASCDYTIIDTVACYNSLNYSKPFSVTYSELKCESFTINYPSSVCAVDAGTFVVLESDNITDPSNTQQMPAYFALNDFDLAYTDTEKYGVDAASITEGTAVIIYPSVSALNFTRGNRIRLAVSQDFNTEQIYFDAILRLQKQLEVLDYTYITLYVTDTVTSGDVSRPVILVSSDDYASITGKTSPYTKITISISPAMTLSQYSTLKNQLTYWISRDPERAAIKLSSTNQYIDITLRRSADYSVWLKLISMLTPLLIFPLWYYPQTMMMARRRKDYVVLSKIGKSQREIRLIFLIESALAALSAMLGIIIMCPIGTLIFGFVTQYFELPLSFSIKHFSFGALGLSCLIGGISAMFTVWLGYISFKSERDNNVNT